ncbi:hypothetical protein [Microlunatus sp. Gsoil 973]|jgi:hypothetical protein|uniref:hypothetical protein n=1 Tax=Microlunatus sp. Gsoil 973 TaxID=2672569 RepID=UPI0012B4A62D|nr:hypothetical protein [Microlunatus sp. Gsoil 973]QGN34936.1 hypothetical protein GJV80_21300 [Microlunatus sp. Gsoil 973]
MTTTQASRADGIDITRPVADLVRWLETSEGAEGTFAPDCFADISLPQWRLQTDSREGLAAVRADNHPTDGPGSVRVERVEQTDRGFVMSFEERWQYAGQHWYCREMLRADVGGGRIVELAVACTGDWDEATQQRHAQEVTLQRP